MLRRGLLILVPGLSVCTTARPQRAFAPGQVWSVKSAQPTSVKAVIGRVEPFNGGGMVIHVSLIDVPIPAGLPNAGGTTAIGHMPFDQAAFSASVGRLVGANAATDPAFESGYAQWRAAQGGVFTISIPQALEFAFQAIKRGR
jgi:hypothetical protein